MLMQNLRSIKRQRFTCLCSNSSILHFYHSGSGPGSVDRSTSSELQAGQIEEFNDSFEEVFGSSEDTQTASATLQSQHMITGNTLPLDKEAGTSLSHVDNRGEASMVDVGGKAATARVARASGRVVLGSLAFRAVRDNALAKGDILSVARVAGIMAAKQTSSLIPLCHSLALDRVSLDFRLRPDLEAVDVVAEAQCSGKTGVEMEALTAISVAALTVYDMCKAVSKDIRITDVQLEEKRGGKSGTWKR